MTLMFALLFVFSLVLTGIGVWRSEAFQTGTVSECYDYISNLIWWELIWVSVMWLSVCLLKF